MKFRFVLVSLLLIGIAADVTSATDKAFITAAAKRIDNAIQWQESSVVVGDFTCKGHSELAILGTSSKEIVIAIFTEGTAKPIEVMRFSGVARSPKSAILAIEPLDFTLQDFRREVGAVPDGLVPSKTCVGLNMTDQMVDSAHIYWHRKRGRFESWSR